MMEHAWGTDSVEVFHRVCLPACPACAGRAALHSQEWSPCEGGLVCSPYCPACAGRAAEHETRTATVARVWADREEVSPDCPAEVRAELGGLRAELVARALDAGARRRGPSKWAGAMSALDNCVARRDR